MRESTQFDDDFLNGSDPAEELLARLEPAPSGVDRAAVLKHAAQSARHDGAASRTAWRRPFWPASTALSLSAAVVLGCLYADAARQPAPQPRIVYIQQPAAERSGEVDSGHATANRRVIKKRAPARRFVIPEDQSTVVSLMTRARFPALTTRVDNLPAARPQPDVATAESPNVGNGAPAVERAGGLRRPANAKPLFPWKL